MFGKTAPRPFRDVAGRKVSVHRGVAAQLDALWSAFNDAITRAATFSPDRTYPRALHDEIKQAGAKLVEGQTNAGVWLIHPANAKPGYLDDDPRIID